MPLRNFAGLLASVSPLGMALGALKGFRRFVLQRSTSLRARTTCIVAEVAHPRRHAVSVQDISVMLSLYIQRASQCNAISSW